MVKKRHLFAALCAVLLSGSAAHAGLSDLLHPRRHVHSLRISRQASYQLAPGDFVEIGVSSGHSWARSLAVVARKAQVLQIAELGSDMMRINLSLTKREKVSLITALSGRDPAVALRVVQRQPREAVLHFVDDGIRDLDFDDVDNLAKTEAAAD